MRKATNMETLKTTKIAIGIYRVELNGTTYDLFKTEWGEWEIYQVTTCSYYGGEKQEWETTLSTKKDCVEWLQENR